MLSIVGITAIVAQTKGNIQIRNMIPIDGIRSFAPFIHKHFGIIEQLIAFGVLLAIFRTIYLEIREKEWQSGYGLGFA